MCTCSWVVHCRDTTVFQPNKSGLPPNLPPSGVIGLIVIPSYEAHFAPPDKRQWVVTTHDEQFDGTLELVVAKPHCRGDHFARTPASLKKQLRLRQVKSGDDID